MRPDDEDLLRRTRSAVVNVMVAEALGIAASGWFLRGRARAALAWPADRARDLALGTLFVVVGLSYLGRRVAAGRSALRDPGTRPGRFYRAHVAGALVGALAVPIGLAYALVAGPSLATVAPFWVAALALGVLAIPRGSELEGLD